MTSSVEVCDHQDCPARATVAFVRGYLELTFCRHHAYELWRSLLKENWERINPPEGSE